MDAVSHMKALSCVPVTYAPPAVFPERTCASLIPRYSHRGSNIVVGPFVAQLLKDETSILTTLIRNRTKAESPLLAFPSTTPPFTSFSGGSVRHPTILPSEAPLPLVVLVATFVAGCLVESRLPAMTPSIAARALMFFPSLRASPSSLNLFPGRKAASVSTAPVASPAVPPSPPARATSSSLMVMLVLAAEWVSVD